MRSRAQARLELIDLLGHINLYGVLTGGVRLDQAFVVFVGFNQIPEISI